MRATCRHKHRYLFGFSGSLRKGKTVSRTMLIDLHDGKRVWTRKLGDFIKAKRSTDFTRGTDEPTYLELLKDSEFAGVPRGDSLFSYRLLDVMSAGAIPVIYSDGWVLPFAEIISWQDCAIMVSESDANRTIEIIESISLERRCEMRTYVIHVYEKYLSSMDKVLNTILSILDKRAKSMKSYVNQQRIM